MPGAYLPQVYSSDSILDIDCLPERLVVIGGGPISDEPAQIFHSLGAQVSLLKMARTFSAVWMKNWRWSWNI